MNHTQTIFSKDAPLALRRRELRLSVDKGIDRKKSQDFSVDRLVVGTHPSCDFVLQDPTASRFHCEIALVSRGYALRDLGSTNGTFVDRLRLGEVIVESDVRLRVGDSLLRLKILGSTVDIPLSTHTRFGPLLGKSPAMRRVFERLAKVAPSDATVLITGESGTGKEVCARAIHEHSRRADKPLVVVDCGALPANLIESELFGHERGAFTGAVKDRIGAFERAQGGTVFLDELGELPLELQTRLLGVLERREIQRVGSTDRRSVDVRVVAATNRDLRREINSGAFREDLFFRLAVVTVEMPPLRERPEDVDVYLDAFVAEHPDVAFDHDTRRSLRSQPWPGNVRELRNALERAAALGEVELHEPAGTLPQVGAEVDPSIPFKVGKAELVDTYERSYVTALMRDHDQNITQAARAAQIDRVYLLRLLDKFGLRPARRK